ncbi:hypothetical protein DSL92_04070 [Billgrantia gudaonensis]|uniref:Uncharacterized protein n=1 Tax=Billgrantia gudaonensis TaxID=376427 RepID=A0A3S0QRY1_9GAMM|nr:hypothetical protein DSL92_04070 [Halomonas gudaonensis]
MVVEPRAGGGAPAQGPARPVVARYPGADEADRMLDMGFQAAMEAIVAETPPSRRTWLFSDSIPMPSDPLPSG